MDETSAATLKAIAKDFLEGRLLPLETALALAPFEDDAPAELQKRLTPMVAIESETDDIPLGHRRELWHPDVRAKEDAKHDRAQAWAEPMVRETCNWLVANL